MSHHGERAMPHVTYNMHNARFINTSTSAKCMAQALDRKFVKIKVGNRNVTFTASRDGSST